MLFKLFILIKMEVKLKLTSFNCNGFKNRNYDYIRDIFNKCNILLLQETWLFEFEHKQICNVIPQCQYYAVSAMDESNIIQAGRPYGGCGIVWHKNLQLSFVPIQTVSKRLCALNIKSSNVNILIINVYMPYDDHTENSFNTYGDTLCEISSIIQSFNGCDIILGGDFNVDFSRTGSKNLDLLKDFLITENLTCESLQCIANNFTYESSTGNKSFIDHFLVSSSFTSTVSVSYDGNNLSDHKPISMETNYVANTTTFRSISNYFLNWEHASPENIQNNKTLLDSHLNNFLIP